MIIKMSLCKWFPQDLIINITASDEAEGIIAGAKKYIYIQTPYLIPEESIFEALIIAANSGIDVRIMVPCMLDHPFVYRATEYYAKYLVVHGVKVYKYNDGFIHAKTMVSGSNISSVGSANQDFRSYTLNLSCIKFKTPIFTLLAKFYPPYFLIVIIII